MLRDSGRALALTETGQVYRWGTRLLPSTCIIQTTPQLITELGDKKVIAIAVASSRMLALTDRGQIYNWGTSYSSRSTDLYTPTLVTGLEKINIKAISACEFSSLAVSDTGDFYVWNGDRFNGLKDEMDGNQPLKFIFPEQSITKKEAESVIQSNNSSYSCTIS